MKIVLDKEKRTFWDRSFDKSVISLDNLRGSLEDIVDGKINGVYISSSFRFSGYRYATGNSGPGLPFWPLWLLVIGGVFYFVNQNFADEKRAKFL